MNETKYAVGYVRVSTRMQTEHVSPESQEAMIRKWCENKGYTLIEPIYYDRGVSGKSLKNRPEAKVAIEIACAHKAALVFYSVSRIARSVPETYKIKEQLGKAGAIMVSLTEPIADATTPEGEAFLGMLAVFAQFERRLIGKRTRDTLKYLRKNGRLVGRIPYGWKRDLNRPHIKHVNGMSVTHYPYLIEDEYEQKVIEMVVKMKPAYSLEYIANQLNQEGSFTRKNKPWTRYNVWWVLWHVRTVKARKEKERAEAAA